MFDILIELFNCVVFLKHCYGNYICLIKNVKGSYFSYFYLPLNMNRVLTVLFQNLNNQNW